MNKQTHKHIWNMCVFKDTFGKNEWSYKNFRKENINSFTFFTNINFKILPFIVVLL